jgi:hypothetical protein
VLAVSATRRTSGSTSNSSSTANPLTSLFKRADQRLALAVRQAGRAASGKAVKQAEHLVKVADFSGLQLACKNARFTAVLEDT